MVLAARLQHKPLQDWARLELEGYPIDTPLPAYRVLRGRNKGQFHSELITGILEIPINLLPEALRPRYRQHEFRDSAAECAHLIAGLGPDAQLQIPWPIELALKYGSKLIAEGQCISAWMEVSPAELAAVADQIKTKVLAFALEIEAADPRAGEVGGVEGLTLAPERVAQIFQTNITGTVQNLALGSSQVAQAAVGHLVAGDEKALLKALEALGISEPERNELQAAIAQDKPAGMAGMGPKVREWLGGIAKKAGETAASEAAKASVEWVSRALAAYFGASP